MQVAQITGSNVQVEIISVNGGWTTVRDTQSGKEFKVRNGSLGKVTTVTQPTTLEAVDKKADTRTGKEADFLKSGNILPTTRAKMPLELRKNGKVDALYLQFYQPVVVERAGKKVRTMDKGDALAVQLRALDLQGVYAVAAKALGTSVQDLVERFAHLNFGMQRMNLGNMIRRVDRKAAK
jgi:hypothetical protein